MKDARIMLVTMAIGMGFTAFAHPSTPRSLKTWFNINFVSVAKMEIFKISCLIMILAISLKVNANTDQEKEFCLMSDANQTALIAMVSEQEGKIYSKYQCEKWRNLRDEIARENARLERKAKKEEEEKKYWQEMCGSYDDFAMELEEELKIMGEKIVVEMEPEGDFTHIESWVYPEGDLVVGLGYPNKEFIKNMELGTMIKKSSKIICVIMSTNSIPDEMRLDIENAKNKKQ